MVASHLIQTNRYSETKVFGCQFEFGHLNLSLLPSSFPAKPPWERPYWGGATFDWDANPQNWAAEATQRKENWESQAQSLKALIPYYILEGKIFSLS